MAAPLSIGFLVGTTYDTWKDEIKAFNDELVSNGWTAGTDFKIEYQSAAGQQNFYTAIANDFANTKRPNPIDVIVTGGTNATVACITATLNVPQIKVFFATAGELGPYFTKLASKNTTGISNVTGISNQQIQYVPDRLYHMKTYVPALLAPTAFTVFGLIGNANAQNVIDEMAAVVAQALPDYGLTAVQSKTTLQTVGDIPTVIQSVQSQGAQALYVCTDPLITSNAEFLNECALTAGLPTMHAFKKNLAGSGSNKLLYLGYELTDLFSQIAGIIYNWRTTRRAALPAPTTPTGPINKQP